MKRFTGFLIKEFYHIFRDKRTILILFGIPVVQVLLFGFVITNEIKDVKIAILDHSKDPVTLEITQKVLSSGYFIMDEGLKSAKNIEKSFKAGEVSEVIIFEKDFAKKLEKERKADVQIIADASDPNNANLIVNYTSAIIRDYVQKKNQLAKMPLQITPEVRMLFNPGLEGVYMFVPGTMALILMLISAMMTSISIAREKEMGTMEVLLISPLRPLHIILGKVTPYLLLSFINAVIIVLLGIFVFGMPLQGSMILLLAESMLFILLALSLGILISTATNSQQTAMMISLVGLMLPTILLSGFIFPIENMPDILQWLSYIMPPRYYIDVIKNIMLKGTGLAYVWKETLVLLGMTMFFIALSTKKFKNRLE